MRFQIWIFFLYFLFLFSVFFFFSLQKKYSKESSSITKSFQEKLSAFSAWREIFEVSKEQKLISSEVLITTAKFMIEERSQDDPDLIKFVSSLIRPPCKDPLNLSVRGKSDFSQHGQTKIIEKILNSQRNGFFIEAGAYDGEEMSNTVFLELERNWTGILIEPVPSFYQKLIRKNRNVFTLNACIANNRPLIAKFSVKGGLSGRKKEFSDFHVNWIGSDFQTIYVPCFPLYTILKAINRSKVDYFSVDLEGGEFDVISNIDYSKIYIKLFSIEWAWDHSRKSLYIDFLRKYDYKLAEIGYVDVFMIKNI